MSNWQKEFARLLPEVHEPPSVNAMALGHMMREWLQNAVADGGTSVDCGGGMGAYDLWAQVGGERVYITIHTGRADAP